MVTAELMPSLYGFLGGGVLMANHHAGFPSETRANIANFVTGVHPSRHNFPGNAYLERNIVPRRVINTADANLIETMDDAYGGGLFNVDTLGEMLGRHGRTYVTISTASAGTTRLLHHKGRFWEKHLCVSCHFREVSHPDSRVDEIIDRFGPPPIATTPDLEAMTYGVDIFLNYVWPNMAPDVTVLWLNEPDASYHNFGIGSPESKQAIVAADGEFRRICDWWSMNGRDEGVQVIVMSDHGHVTTIENIDLEAELTAAGFSVGTEFRGNQDITLAPGACGQIYVRDRDPALTSAVGEWLLAQPWCGVTFSADKTDVEGFVAGTFAHSLGTLNYSRVADLVFSFHADNSVNQYGYGGRSYYSAANTYHSMHGGLHPAEMKCLVGAAGSKFGENIICEEPSAIVDLLPTILKVLELPIPSGLHGRVLHEALREASGDTPGASAKIFECVVGNRRQMLTTMKCGRSTYIISGDVSGGQLNGLPQANGIPA